MPRAIENARSLQACRTARSQVIWHDMHIVVPVGREKSISMMWSIVVDMPISGKMRTVHFSS